MNKLEVIDDICLISIDNKPQNYLIKPEFISSSELIHIIETHHCKAIVITGVGRHFSAGADIASIHEMCDNGTLELEITKGKELLNTMKQFKIPVIACIEGACFGGGLEIALNADVKIASRKAIFAFPEVHAGLMPGLSGTTILPKVTGRKNALDIILKGDTIDAEKALLLSIIDEICEPKTSLEVGMSFALSITQNRAVHIIHAVVEAIRNVDLLPYNEALQRETELFCQLAKKVADKHEI